MKKSELLQDSSVKYLSDHVLLLITLSRTYFFEALTHASLSQEHPEGWHYRWYVLALCYLLCQFMPGKMYLQQKGLNKVSECLVYGTACLSKLSKICKNEKTVDLQLPHVGLTTSITNVISVMKPVRVTFKYTLNICLKHSTNVTKH